MEKKQRFGTVGFIGLGNMGKPMAANVLKVADRLLVNDHHIENEKYLVSLGAETAEDVQIAEQAEVIVLSLPAPPQVREQVAGPDGLIAHGHAGQYIIDTSTVDVETSRAMAEAAAAKGITYIDAPVSGGGHGAAAGTLTVMLGATQEETAPVEALIRTFGGTLRYMGKRGAGSAIKIINNFMSFAIQVVNGEALLMADHAGISFDEFYEVVGSSGGANTILTNKKDKIRSGNIDAAFTVKLVIKDLELGAQVCRDAGIANFTLNQAIQFYRMAQKRGYGDKDSSAVIRMIRELEQ